MGAQMLKEVASKTSDVAGDGTTTATVLAQMVARLGIKNVTSGADPMGLKRGMDKAVKAVDLITGAGCMQGDIQLLLETKAQYFHRLAEQVGQA